MQRFRVALARAVVVAVVTGALLAPDRAESQLPLEPAKDSGQSITAAYEGWFKNEDGTYVLIVGYFNRNRQESLDIPVGPNNRIEPGDPDRGQPTHFLPRRQWGVFTIQVPADFPGKKLTWHLTANDKPTQVPMKLDPLWEVSPYRDAAQGNTPPILRFEKDGPAITGPPLGVSASYETTLSEPLTLTVWADDDAVVDEYRRDRKVPLVRVSWSKFRGPGDVSFSDPKLSVEEKNEEATTTATFSEPGDYVLRVQANDISGDGGGGAQCCWTNAHVEVTVAPDPSSQ